MLSSQRPVTRTQARARSQQFEPPTKFEDLWVQSNRRHGGKNYFYLDEGRVIGKVASSSVNLEAEHAWLTYLQPLVNTKRVVIPEPIGPVVHDDSRSCMYLRVIPGQTLEQWIEKNGPLTDEIARRIADAYMALREAGAPDIRNDYLIPGGLEWYVKGHAFNQDNEAECQLSTFTEFKNMMNERFRVGVGPKAALPAAPRAFAHGDLSPTNILLTEDNRIAIIDFGFSAWLPEYWDAYMLSTEPYWRPEGFLEPIRKALKEKGIWLHEDDKTRLLMSFFTDWSNSREGTLYLRLVYRETHSLRQSSHVTCANNPQGLAQTTTVSAII